jgi:hypothetical protein
MDKQSLVEIIANVYKSLSPIKVSVFQKNAEFVNIRVISEFFSGMTFSSRFKLLNQLFKDQNEELFNKHIYIFEAFTSGEVKHLAASTDSDEVEKSDGFKHSAKEL